MKTLLFILTIALLSSCQTASNDYYVHSAAEARAFARRAVEVGYIHQGGEAALVAEKSVGKPQDGKFSPQKIDAFLNQYAAEHPRLMEINKAATTGKISEKERVILVNVLHGQEERLAEARNAEAQAAAADLDQSAQMNAQGSSYRMNSALMQATPQSGYSGYGTGFGGRTF